MVYEEICIYEMLERSAHDLPNHTAVICQDYQVSYQELIEMVYRFATCLKGLGVETGDRVAVVLLNCIQAVVSYYAILELGAIAVMNNPVYSDSELQYQFTDSGSKVLICLDALLERMEFCRDQLAKEMAYGN
ncbi:MAG: AMP-binding protein [Methylocystaceae bacterium]